MGGAEPSSRVPAELACCSGSLYAELSRRNPTALPRSSRARRRSCSSATPAAQPLDEALQDPTLAILNLAAATWDGKTVHCALFFRNSRTPHPLLSCNSSATLPNASLISLAEEPEEMAAPRSLRLTRSRRTPSSAGPHATMTATSAMSCSEIDTPQRRPEIVVGAVQEYHEELASGQAREHPRAAGERRVKRGPARGPAQAVDLKAELLRFDRDTFGPRSHSRRNRSR
jgi:hypothetical protein